MSIESYGIIHVLRIKMIHSTVNVYLYHCKINIWIRHSIVIAIEVVLYRKSDLLKVN